MAQHPNVQTIDRMTQAALIGDTAELSKIFSEDMVFHVRGTLPRVGDHRGAGGFLSVIESILESSAVSPFNAACVMRSIVWTFGCCAIFLPPSSANG